MTGVQTCALPISVIAVPCAPIVSEVESRAGEGSGNIKSGVPLPARLHSTTTTAVTAAANRSDIAAIAALYFFMLSAPLKRIAILYIFQEDLSSRTQRTCTYSRSALVLRHILPQAALKIHDTQVYSCKFFLDINIIRLAFQAFRIMFKRSETARSAEYRPALFCENRYYPLSFG